MELDKFFDEYDKLKLKLDNNQREMMILMYNIMLDDQHQWINSTKNLIKKVNRLNDMIDFFGKIKDWPRYSKLQDIKTKLYEQNID